MTTQSPQSLPSFAQTFGGTPSLPRMSDNTSLPPIHRRASPLDRIRSTQASPQPPSSDPKHINRKRLHSEAVADNNSDVSGSEDHRSPRAVRVKEETDNDVIPLNNIQAPLPKPQGDRTHTSPSSSSSPHPSKKRRFTISGAAPQLNTDVRRPSRDSGISPVVMGFKIRENDPDALQQVRSMINLKQQQQALIEQRRGSTAGILPPSAPPEVNIVNPADDRSGQSHKNMIPGRAGRRGSVPHSVLAHRRSVVAPPIAVPPQPIATNPRPPSPTHQHAQHHLHHHQNSHPAPAHSTGSVHSSQNHVHPSTSSGPSGPPPPSVLSAAPSGFARRRASRQLGGKAKPADLVINSSNPSDSHMQPVIQSAPPIPRAPGQLTLGRYPSTMAIPTLPSVIAAGGGVRRVATGHVPPTPTRLTLPHRTVPGPTAGGSTRSPPAASVPIANSLVPPTPASLHHPGYSGEKSAFLAPFEMFYDALSDSKQLKQWLGEQVQKSQSLMVSLERQQEQMEERVNSLVDKRISATREEVYGLRVRVDELEQQLRSARAQGFSPNMGSAKGKARANGVQVMSPMVPEITYTFPPTDNRPETIRRISSPASDMQNAPSQTSSPVPFDAGRRVSISAVRYDPPRHSESSSARHSAPYPPPPPPRELPPPSYPPPHTTGRGSWSPLGVKTAHPTSSTRSSLSQTVTGPAPERPGLTRRTSGQGNGSQSHMPPPHSHGNHTPEPGRESRAERSEREAVSQAISHRRNSIAAPGARRQSREMSPMDSS